MIIINDSCILSKIQRYPHIFREDCTLLRLVYEGPSVTSICHSTSTASHERRKESEIGKCMMCISIAKFRSYFKLHLQSYCSFAVFNGNLYVPTAIYLAPFNL